MKSNNGSSNMRKTLNFAWVMGLSILIAVVLVGALIYYSGAWNFVANTRLLDLMIGGGIIKYHDKNAGFVEGVPELKYYLMSQDPIRWDLVGVVIAIFLLFFTLKAAQFHGFARLFGIRAGPAQNLRAFSHGLLVEKLFPFGLGDVAAAKTLQDGGAPLDRAKAVSFAGQVAVIFETAVFAVIGLLVIGWSGWLSQIFWPLVMVGVAYLLVRKHRRERAEPGQESTATQTRKLARILGDRPMSATWLGLLSLVAFGLEDIAAYFTAMAFTGPNVVLQVDFSILLMGVVGSYLARLIRVTPGGLGQFEWGFAAALYFGGVGLPECVAIAVLDNVFRYIAAAMFYLFTTRRQAVSTGLRSVVAVFTRAVDEPEPADLTEAVIEHDAPEDIPQVPMPRIGPAATLWSRVLVAGGVLLGLFFVDELTLLLFDFWLLDSVGLLSVFWTNFKMGAMLFVFGFVTMGFGVAYPAFANRLPKPQKRFVVGLAAVVGSVGGYFTATAYRTMLFSTGVPFGNSDPVFENDLGFYVYTLSALWVVFRAAIFGTVLGLLSAIGCAYAAQLDSGGVVRGDAAGISALRRLLGVIASRTTLIPLALVGVVLAYGEWLTRYELLFKDNSENAVYVGPAYVDVVGFFTHLNYIWVTTFVILGLTAAAVIYLYSLRRAVHGGDAKWSARLPIVRNVALLLILIDFGFKGAVTVRDVVFVTPDAPVIQLDWIDHHVKATRAAYKLDGFELVEFIPKSEGDPVPDVEELLASPTIRNAPLWPGYTAYLERFLDPQHANRVIQTGGDTTVYGPTLEIFQQQQKLRTYYNFLGVDTVRYRIDGEKKMLVSAVRELPLVEPHPWLGWFGQRFMLFTHGHGLVMAPVSEVDVEGRPRYASMNIPTENRYPEIAVENERVYYGEGAATIAYSNVDRMKELDYPTNQDRAELVLPQDIEAGVHIDSLLKRLVFGWRSGQFWTVLFSTLITDDTRVHFYRTPIGRLERVAPFLYFDTNPYAVAVDGDIVWMVNALTWSDRYPASTYKPLGDKSDERARYPRPIVNVNYVEDSVKASINASTGKMTFYKISDEPVIETWARIYPDAFQDGDTMPERVREQLTYPIHLFHIQFDDIYIYYHMNDPMYFFNMEDQWDDGDEVLGPILDNGKAITFSVEPYYFMLETGKGGVPAAKGDPVQFAVGLVFTPEKALNLRAIPLVYQDGEDYGRVIVLQVPKGIYSIGPEQADATIDQNPTISEQISWWNRLGTDVIRGHTSTLVVDGEVIYVEPIFIRSQQNPVTQLRRVAVVFRGVVRMGETLEEALRAAVAAYESSTQLAENQTMDAAFEASGASR
jgi:uncharacterized membrane protein (UPF0182 family)